MTAAGDAAELEQLERFVVAAEKLAVQMERLTVACEKTAMWLQFLAQSRSGGGLPGVL